MVREKTFSLWLYEEIIFMKLLQPIKRQILCREASTIEKSFKCTYDASAIDIFPFLHRDELCHLRNELND